ncbi:MAG: hypothetical protein JW955_07090 [Sedimentisphaerales bacterium]|nr:hypothetical protein [Sedimentisphaerales bacterium]
MRPCTGEQPTAMIRFTCDRCGYRIKTPQGTAGRRGRCPKCHHTVRVPACPDEWVYVAREVEESEIQLKPEQFDRMGRIAVYLAGRRGLAGSIIGALVFGLIGIAVGAASLQENPLNVLMIGIGGLLLLDAFVLSVTRHPAALLLDGIATCTVGVWNILVALGEYASGVPGGGGSFWGMLGLCQCVWGCRILAGYGAAAQGARQAHDKALVEEVRLAIRTFGKAYFRLPTDMIAFSGDNRPWQGRLMASYAVFATAQCTEFLFVARDDVAVHEQGNSSWSGKRKVDIRLRDRVLHGAMSSESLERLARWKAAKDPAVRTPHHLPAGRVPVRVGKPLAARDVSVYDERRVPRHDVTLHPQRRQDGTRSSKVHVQPLRQNIRRIA